MTVHQLRPRRPSEPCLAILFRNGYRSDAEWQAAVEQARTLLVRSGAIREDHATPGLVRFYRQGEDA